MPKISIIIPIYNVEKYLRRCLDSVSNQTFSDWEAICVDDGTKDSCGKIIDEYAARDSRFVALHKENGGLSDARNEGIKLAKGEFIVYLDSDDFIHPQTFEIALSIQERSGAEMVSWYKDKAYRNKLILRMLFNSENVNFKPSSFYRSYDASAVEFDYTDDVISKATEYSHPKDIENPIKHCYVWRHLIRREILDGISFEKGLSFEDFPWWSAVLLKNPKTAYTMLPLYYYYCNMSSIDRSSSRGKKISSWVRGLGLVLDLYAKEATPHQMECWIANFKWPVIQGQIARHLDVVKKSDKHYDYISESLRAMVERGVFSDASSPADLKAVARINKFLGIA